MVDQELLLKDRLKLLLTQRISPVVLQNCIDLIEREQVGIKKYGSTLTDANLSRGELLQHAREEALDLANYLMAEQQRKPESEILETLSAHIQNYKRFSESPSFSSERREVYRMVADSLSRIL